MIIYTYLSSYLLKNTWQAVYQELYYYMHSL